MPNYKKYMLLLYKGAVYDAGEGRPSGRGILTRIIANIPRFEGAHSPAPNISLGIHKAKNDWFLL